MLENMFQLKKQPYGKADEEWDAFVAQHPNGSVLQTTRWAQLKNHFGWSSHRVWLRRDNKLGAGAQVLFRSGALGLARIAYVPHGALVDWDDEEEVEVLLNQIDVSAYEDRAGMLKMEPLLWQRDIPPERWQALCERFACIWDTDTIQPPRTLIVNLEPPEEEI